VEGVHSACGPTLKNQRLLYAGQIQGVPGLEDEAIKKRGGNTIFEHYINPKLGRVAQVHLQSAREVESGISIPPSRESDGEKRCRGRENNVRHAVGPVDVSEFRTSYQLAE